MKRFLYIFSCLFCTSSLSAQIGGNNTYEFLNTPSSARITALGGNLITVKDSDVSLAYFNPASLNNSMHQAISFNYNFHLADIKDGYAAYAHYLEKYQTTIQVGAKFLSYGDFDTTDEFGTVLGTFNAGEYAFLVGAGKQLYERLSVGANLKVISSQLETYSSFGMAMDLSAMYSDTSSQFNLTLIAKNIGGQFSKYNDQKENLPFEMQIGISKRLKHLPFRWSIIYHNLDRWNVLYDDPDQEENDLLIGSVNTEDSPSKIFFDNLGRHFIVNGEFLLGKRELFNVRFGYNHLLKKELSVESLRSAAGFSFGLGINIKMFRIEYGHNFYHLAGGPNHISISTNLQRFTNKI